MVKFVQRFLFVICCLIIWLLATSSGLLNKLQDAVHDVAISYWCRYIGTSALLRVSWTKDNISNNNISAEWTMECTAMWFLCFTFFWLCCNSKRNVFAVIANIGFKRIIGFRILYLLPVLHFSSTVRQVIEWDSNVVIGMSSNIHSTYILAYLAIH